MLFRSGFDEETLVRDQPTRDVDVTCGAGDKWFGARPGHLLDGASPDRPRLSILEHFENPFGGCVEDCLETKALLEPIKVFESKRLTCFHGATMPLRRERVEPAPLLLLGWAPMSGEVRIERDGPVARLVFDHEKRRNAITVDMWEAIPDAVRTVQEDPGVRVVIMRGAGDRKSVV